MNQVAGKVESKSRKGNSIKVGGEWYSTFASDDLDHVNWKDEVEFLYEQKGKYKNIKGKVEVTSKTQQGSKATGDSYRPPAGGYSNLGVEIGHASNLAMRMMEQCKPDEGYVGTPEYWKRFAEYTNQAFTMMKGIRANIEAGDKPAPKKEATVPASNAEEFDDIF